MRTTSSGDFVMRPTRRQMIAAAGAGLAITPLLEAREPHWSKGNLNQSICRWCYGRTPLEKLCEEAVKISYKSIELLLPPEILKVKKYGLTCAIIGGADIANGLNRVENHPKILKELRERIEFAAAEGCPHVICMSGNRTIKGRTVTDDEGLETCAKGIKEVIGLAEEKKVNLV